jgi:hypothetical protein
MKLFLTKKSALFRTDNNTTVTAVLNGISPQLPPKKSIAFSSAGVAISNLLPGDLK